MVSKLARLTGINELEEMSDQKLESTLKRMIAGYSAAKNLQRIRELDVEFEKFGSNQFSRSIWNTLKPQLISKEYRILRKELSAPDAVPLKQFVAEENQSSVSS